MLTDTITATGTWTAPAGVTSVDVECFGQGGLGGLEGGGGGGGGAYSRQSAITVVPSTVYGVTINETDTYFGDGTQVKAKAGGNGGDGSPGIGGDLGDRGIASSGIGDHQN